MPNQSCDHRRIGDERWYWPGSHRGLMAGRINKRDKRDELQRVTSWYGLPGEIAVEHNLVNFITNRPNGLFVFIAILLSPVAPSSAYSNRRERIYLQRTLNKIYAMEV